VGTVMYYAGEQPPPAGQRDRRPLRPVG
jgi:hypothetical protein